MSLIAVSKGALRRRMSMVGAVLLMGAVASAGAAGALEVIHARQHRLHSLGREFKSLRDRAGDSHPNWSAIAGEANDIERLAAALPGWFPAGSGPGHGVKTRAAAAIWAQPKAFARAARTFLNRARDLQQAAARHDRRALAPRARALGEACGSCHRRFRARGSWW